MRSLSFLLLMNCAGVEEDTDSPADTIGWDVTTENLLGLAASGVEVCTEVGCDTSDGTGALHLELPVGESRMTVLNEDLETHLFLTIVDVPPTPDRILVASEALLDLITADLPAQDASKGMLLVSNLFEEGHANTVNIAADGPHYISAGFNGTDPQATVTTTTGFSLFVNVDPGDVEVQYIPPAGRTCSPTPWIWAGSGADASRAAVTAGVLSTTELDCTD